MLWKQHFRAHTFLSNTGRHCIEFVCCLLLIIGCSGNSNNKQHWSLQLKVLCTHFTCYQLIKHFQPVLCGSHMNQLFVFGLASSLFGRIRIDYSAHYSAPKWIRSKYSVQPYLLHQKHNQSMFRLQCWCACKQGRHPIQWNGKPKDV